ALRQLRRLLNGHFSAPLPARSGLLGSTRQSRSAPSDKFVVVKIRDPASWKVNRFERSIGFLTSIGNPGERKVYMYQSIQLTRTTASRRASQVTRRKNLHSLIASLQPAAPILAGRIAIPLLLLLLAASTAFGGSATWNLHPTSSDWHTDRQST